MAEPGTGRIIGRYALFDVLAAGGMATVHVGRLLGPVGFARTVAIKRLHPQFAKDPEFVSMFLDEARMCARIRHPNVVPTLDVVATKGELFLVMEYVAGESLAHLLRASAKLGQKVPWKIAVAIATGALHGLHAAHEAKDERGLPLHLVHRDVSPQNILVGTDGMARVLDFGIAKATGRLHTTRAGAVKGKLGYMAPEQMAGENITRQADVYAAAVTLWETLAGQRLFDGETETVMLARVLTAEVKPPSTHRSDLPAALDALVMKGLSRVPEQRFSSAREMALALEALPQAPLGEIGAWVEQVAKSTLEDRAKRVTAVENGTEGTPVHSLESEHPMPITPAKPAEAVSGSIRPMARSEAKIEIDEAPAPPKSRRLLPALGALGFGVVLVVGAWSFTRRDPASGPGPAASASSSAPAVAVAATTTPVPTSVASQVVVSSSLPEAVSAAPSVSPSTGVPSAQRWGKLPTATSSNKFNLGGRKN